MAAVEDAGIKVTEGSDAEADERRVTGFARFDDPGGNPIELFYGPILDHKPVVLPTVSSFVTGDMGMGHVIVTGEDGRALKDFYIDVLGFYERNTMGGRERTVWFMSSNDRHHTLGVTSAPGRGRLIHLMVEAASFDDVGLALDRRREVRHPADEQPRQAHQRRDDVLLRLLAGAVRDRVRLGRPEGGRRAAHLRDHVRRSTGATSSSRRPPGAPTPPAQ